MKYVAALLVAALGMGPLAAQDADDQAVEESGPTPEEVLAAAPADHWLPIPVSDLLIMRLPDTAEGESRELVIQLMPADYSGGHVRNVRRLAQQRWWDGTKIYRVAPDFVTQFGGNPTGKPVPEGLETVPESEYYNAALGEKLAVDTKALEAARIYANTYQGSNIEPLMEIIYENQGADTVGFAAGWPVGLKNGKAFPVTCRGSLSPPHYDPPDAGTGADESIVTGEAARNLDESFGFVGRVIDGLDHAVNLTRGDKPMGFISEIADMTEIESIRLALTLPPEQQPHYEYLASYSPYLLRYLAAQTRFGTVCTHPVPIRKVS